MKFGILGGVFGFFLASQGFMWYTLQFWVFFAFLCIANFFGWLDK